MGKDAGKCVPSLSEVARVAGVSKSTVSRYIKGELRITPSTQKKIEDAMRALNWKAPKKTASGFSASELVVALLVPGLQNPFYSEFATELYSATSGRQVTLGVDITGGTLRGEILSIQRALRNPAVDAILLLGSNLLGDSVSPEAFTKPLILIDEGVLPTDEESIGFVGANSRDGGFQATSALIAAGHRRIALITGPPELPTAQEREQGYRDALEVAGIPFSGEIVFRGPFSEAFGAAAMSEMVRFADQPTAVFVGADYAAIGVLAAARQFGLDVPDDISIVSFDDVALTNWLNPPLTSIRQPIREMAEEAIRMVVEAANGEKARRVVLPISMSQRSSVGPVPAL